MVGGVLIMILITTTLSLTINIYPTFNKYDSSLPYLLNTWWFCNYNIVSYFYNIGMLRSGVSGGGPGFTDANLNKADFGLILGVVRGKGLRR